jgi:hypothetical protein
MIMGDMGVSLALTPIIVGDMGVKLRDDRHDHGRHGVQAAR